MDLHVALGVAYMVVSVRLGMVAAGVGVALGWKAARNTATSAEGGSNERGFGRHVSCDGGVRGESERRTAFWLIRPSTGATG